MLPGALAHDITEGLKNFIVTGFETSSPFFQGIFKRFVEQQGNFYKGPYLSLSLPFSHGTAGRDYFSGFETAFPPYLHQQQAYDRLRSNSDARSTIIATGTGSGKTECFLYPLLDHCQQNPGQGIKAIIIYPMNALATDQAKRFAEAIYTAPALKDTIRVGLFVGEGENSPHKSMGEHHVITDKDTLRNSPPDILLTNYKMLDYLLIRPKDRPLWQHNQPDTLRYLIVDELHTFDGAQGTDLACLIRRLKARLQIPAELLVCVGTSATLGSGEEKAALAQYASQVFQSAFDEASIISEHRKSMQAFLGRSLIRYQFLPKEGEDIESVLDPDNYDSIEDYLLAQYQVFFPGEDKAQPDDENWRSHLGEKLKEHLFFHNLLRLLEKQPRTLQELSQEIEKTLPQLQAGTSVTALSFSLLNSLCALVALARDPQSPSQPLVQLRLQLWLRELRRMVSRVSDKSEDIHLTFADDVKHTHGEIYLPMVQCSECHSTGWVASKPPAQERIVSDLRLIYNSFFSRDPEAILLFPLDGEQAPIMAKGYSPLLCCACGHLQTEGELCKGCGDNQLVQVFIPDNTRQTRQGGVNRLVSEPDCPVCNASGSMMIFGARVASLLSVAIHHTYASAYNDDKKLIAFSDSVQDAAHRAGFFAARTWQNNIRMAIAQTLAQNDDGAMPLTRFMTLLPEYWRDSENNPTAFDTLRFITEFIAPNMLWYEDYTALMLDGQLPEGSRLVEDIEKRLQWEVLAEFGYRSRIGRSLERTQTAAVGFDPEKIQLVSAKIKSVLAEEIGSLRDIDDEEVQHFILGLLLHLKSRGAIYHRFLQVYIENDGKYFLLTRQTYLPGFGPGAPVPRFLISKNKHSVFDTLDSTRGRTWYQQWLQKTLGQDRLLEDNLALSVYRPVLEALVNEEILLSHPVNDETVWSINPEALFVTDNIAGFSTPDSRSQITVPQAMADLVSGMPSIEPADMGSYAIHEGRHWLRRFYRHGQINRVIAEEHTGLLERDVREKVEQTFMAENNRKPWYPNLLSATPTLEMGVDIGDLSTVMLCSIPPAQANYLQRIGRAGRRDGNALSLAAAAGRPHDLYFYSDPMQMMAGRIEPPGVFLNASAVIERQLTAFCLDSWVATGIDGSAIPERIKAVIDNVEKANLNRFPYNFLEFVKKNAEELYEEFLALFTGELSERTIQYLIDFILAETRDNTSLEMRIICRLHDLVKERKNLKKRIDALKRRITSLEQSPQDESCREEISNLQNERGGLQAVLRGINAKQTLNFMTDEGLIPNYAFPEAGVTLRSVIFRKRKDIQEGEGKYENIVFEYERAGAAAISELAPESRFYAGGRKVQIEQVDLELSEVEQWRFCPRCTHAENLAIGDLHAACPRCGDPMWADAGQVKEMVRLRQVMANTSDRRSRIGDDSDDREPNFYTRQMLADFDVSDIEVAYRITDESLPFGFEFLRKVTFREMNFGKYGDGPDLSVIAGKEAWRPGFRLCRYCGMVQDSRSREQKHAFTCKAADRDADSNIVDCLYLYREFSSEAIRILLPTSNMIGSDQMVNSFIAAIQLGLKLKFGGKVDHLRMMVYEEPVEDSDVKKQFLMLYDSVPGGTGYLHDLMRTTDNLLQVFRSARDTMVSCSCNDDPGKDGCYQCLYAYRNSYGMETTSRDTAIEILSEIIDANDQFESVDTIGNIDINPLHDSELETRFIEAIKRCEISDSRIKIHAQVVNGKPGYFLAVGENCYEIEPQVNISLSEGVYYASRPDFLIRSTRESDDFKPIAVFMDGYQYHKDSVTDDTRKRLALVQSNAFLQWSINWQDVNAQFTSTNDQAINYFNESISHEMSALQAAILTNLDVASLSKVHLRNSFDQLMLYLSNPSDDEWRHIAFIRCLDWFDRSFMQDPDTINKFNALFSESAATDLANIADNLLIHPAVGGFGWVNDEGIVRALCALPLQAISDMDTKALVISASLDMKKKGTDAEFKPVWSGFFHMINLIQFIPAVQFATIDGIQSGVIEPVDFKYAHTVIENNESVETDAALAEFLSMVDETLHQGIMTLRNKGVPLPEPGYELQNESQEIIAEGEMAWADKGIVVLLHVQDASKKVFEDNGWIVIQAENGGDWVDAVLNASGWSE